MSARRVAVIGAGASGLVSAKWLATAGLDPVVFERAERIGGVWTYDQSLPGGGSPSYRSLVTNVSRQKTHLSDHELGGDLGGSSDQRLAGDRDDFPGRARVLRWLEAYADRFDVRRRIRLRTPVRGIERRGHVWHVDGEPFDAVVVASGLFSRPFTPDVAGLDSFQGRVMHATEYMHPEPFADVDVIVVGAGSSGADIAVELARVARVCLSVRAVAPVVPKTVGGRPLDHLLTRRLEQRPEDERGRSLYEAIGGEYRRRGLPDPAVWPAGLAPLVPGRAPTPSEDLAAMILRGTIALQPAIESIDGEHVVFGDGTRRRVDLILFATGHSLELPMLPPGLLPVREQVEIDLYRHVWHPEVAGLAFVGLCRVSGAVPPIAEMQARWIARVLSGAAFLPPTGVMRHEIAERRARHLSAGTEYMRVPFLGYLDEIADLIGARPQDERSLQDAVVSATQYR